MLESTQIIILCIGVIFFILGIEKLATVKGMIYSAIGLGFWFISAAASMYIEVPTATDTYSEQGLQWICWGMVIISIIILIIHYAFYSFNRKYAEQEDKLNLVLSMRDQEEYYK